MKEHIKPLTSIRAIGVFWVIIGHYHAWVYTIGYEPFREIMRYPMLAVDTFFFLSGFVLAYIYSEKFSTPENAKRNGFSFIAYRFGRIYPLHLITFISVLLLTWAGIYAAGNPLAEYKILNNNTFENGIYHTLLLHGTGIIHGASWNYPSWSISVEFILYLCFPLLIPIIIRLKHELWHVLIIGSVCGYYYLTIQDNGLRFDNINLAPAHLDAKFQPTIWENDLLRGLANFIIGLSLHQLYARKFLKNLPWDFILLAISTAMLTMMLTRTPMNIVILVMPLFIYALANLKGFMCIIFNNKILVYLGEISYGLYMWHIPYGLFVLHVFYDNNAGIEFWQWQFIPMILGLVALSAASYHLFETPCRRKIKQWVKNRKAKPTKDKTPSKLIESLTGLRFIAALWVVLHNVSTYEAMDPGYARAIDWGIFSPIINRGLIGVDLFFVLSGFVISLVYQKHFDKDLRWTNILKFYTLRLARIWPLHVSILVLILVIMVFHIPPYVDFGKFSQLIYNFTLTTSWGLYSYADWNGPAWSLSAEWFAYLLFPFISYFLIPRSSLATMLTLLCLLPITAFTIMALDLDLVEDDGIGALIRVTCGFIAGCILYNIYKLNLQYNWHKIHIASWSLLVLSCFIEGELAFFFIPIAVMAIIISCAHSNNESSLLSLSMFTYLGKISFAVYMVHQPVFVLQRHFFGSYYHNILQQQNQGVLWLNLVGSILILIAVAAIFHHMIERPIRGFVKKRIQMPAK